MTLQTRVIEWLMTLFASGVWPKYVSLEDAPRTTRRLLRKVIEHEVGKKRKRGGEEGEEKDDDEEERLYEAKRIKRFEKVAEWSQDLENVFCTMQDVMTLVRSIDYATGGVVRMAKTVEERASIAQALDMEQDHPSISRAGMSSNALEPGTRLMTCEEYAQLVAAPTQRLISLENGPCCVGMIFDRPGKTRRAKYTQYHKRKNDDPAYEMPEDGSNPFQDSMPLPATVNSIFKTLKAKQCFYTYLFEFLTTKAFADLIGPGKRVIIDGLMRYEHGKESPVEVYYDEEEQRVRWRDMCETLYHPEAEADVRVFYWDSYMKRNMQRYSPDVDVISTIESDDGDVFMTALLHASKAYSVEERVVRAPKTYVRKKLVYAREHYTGEELERRKRKKERVKSTPLFRSVKQNYYVDVNELVSNMYECAYSGCKEAEEVKGTCWYGSLQDCPHPVETYVALGFLAGCDYVEGFPQIGFGCMWKCFLSNPARYGRMIIAENTMQDNEFAADSVFRYGVDARVFVEFIRDCMADKFARIRDKLEDGCSLNEAFQLIKENYPAKSYAKCHDMTEDTVYVLAANLAWTLSYFGNGGIPNHTVDDDMRKDEHGLSVHGYELKDPTKPPRSDNVIFSKRVTRVPVFWSS